MKIFNRPTRSVEVVDSLATDMKYSINCPHCHGLIDLSGHKELELAVKAAAGKIRSRNKKVHSGGNPVKLVQCVECGAKMATRYLAKHRKYECPKRES
jgi:hypothetical protein